MLCKCGCGNEAKGHWTHSEKKVNKGKWVDAEYLPGHRHSGDSHHMKRPEWREWFKINNPMHKPEVRAKVSGINSSNCRPEVKESHSKAMVGIKRTEQTKKLLHDFRMGKTYEELYGDRAEEIIEKRRRSIRANGSLFGEKNPMWLGGSSFLPYDANFNHRFKESVKDRDGRKCQLCGTKELLVIHHIDYNKKNTTEVNCITLCRNCNLRVNTKRDFWTSYFNQIIKREQLQVAPIQVTQ